MSYGYDKDKRPSVVSEWNNSVTYNYNEPGGIVTLGRLIDSTVAVGGSNKFTTTYSYVTGVNGSSTYQLASINNNGKVISNTLQRMDILTRLPLTVIQSSTPTMTWGSCFVTMIQLLAGLRCTLTTLRKRVPEEKGARHLTY
jgi:hypothetical protein